MIPAKNICSLCIRADEKFYHLDESIRAPKDLRFEGHTNLQAVLENILTKKGKDGKTTNEICQKCREKIYGIYSFTQQYTKSEKIVHHITDVTVRLKKLKSFSLLTDFKTEFEVIEETDKDVDSLKCSSALCDNSAVSGVVVKMECDNNLKDSIDFNKVTRDLNIGLLGGKFSNAADSRYVEQKKIDFMDSDDAKQITIQDEIIKEEWTMQEGDIFEANANHDVLDREQTKFCYEMCKPSHTDVELKCDQCDVKCKTCKGLRDHKMTHTGVIFACNQCDASFPNKRNLARHLQEVHTDVVFACDHCDATYTTKRALNFHKQIHNGIRNTTEFNCDLCDAKYKTRDGLKHHKMSHAGVAFACYKCDASFSYKKSLIRHLREVHTDAIFACDHCDATYKSKQALNVHKQMINGTLFNCDLCDAKYKSRASLRNHQMSHTGVTFACNKCDASFSNRKGLTDHLRRVHTDAVFSCDHCDVTYKSKRALYVHKQTINGRLFNCDECDTRFKSWGGLRYHKMSHTGVTFPCNKCDANFSNDRSLKQHLRRVHPDAVFSCDQCNTTYINQGNLERHKLTHNGKF